MVKITAEELAESGRCSTAFAVVRKSSENVTRVMKVPLACGRWDCPKCGIRKKLQVRTFVRKSFQDGDVHMLTLTFDRSKSPLETWQQIGKCWNRLNTALKREIGKFSYIRIVEAHKDGLYPHLHVLMSAKIVTEKGLRKITDAGFGWVCDTKTLPSYVAGNYVTDYVSKDLASQKSEKMRAETGTRLVSASRDLGAIYPKEGGWGVVAVNVSSKSADVAIEGEIKYFSKYIDVRVKDDHKGTYRNVEITEDSQDYEIRQKNYKEAISLSDITIELDLYNTKDDRLAYYELYIEDYWDKLSLYNMSQKRPKIEKEISWEQIELPF